MTNEVDTRFYPKGLVPEDRMEPNTHVINPRPGIRKSSEWDSFSHGEWDHEKAIGFLTQNRMTNIKVLEDDSYCALYQLAYTWSVCTDITPNCSYCYRWCFEDKAEALRFLEELVDFDQSPYLNVYKSLKGHRYTSEARIMAYDELGLRKW